MFLRRSSLQRTSLDRTIIPGINYNADIIKRNIVGLWPVEAYDSASDSILDQSGRGHHAVAGSSVGVDAADPRIFQKIDKGIRLSGVALNSASTPDSPELDVTSNLVQAAYIDPADFTPGVANQIIAKWDAAGDHRSYQLVLNTSGGLLAGASTDGTTGTDLFDNSSVPLPLEVPQWVASRTIAATTNNSFWYSYDPPDTPWEDITWTELGVAGTTFVASIHIGTADLEIGVSGGTFQPFTGLVKRAVIVNGDLTDTPVFDVDFTKLVAPFASLVEDSVNAATVTINRSATGFKSSVINRPKALLGGAQYFEIPDHPELDFAAGDPLLAIFAGLQYEDLTPALAHGYLVKSNNLGAAAGYKLMNTTGGNQGFRIADGTNQPVDQLSHIGVGLDFVLVGVRSIIEDDIELIRNSIGSGTPTDDNTVSTLANSFPLRIGANSAVTPGNFDEGEFFVAALSGKDLTNSEARQIGIKLTGIAA